MFNQEGLCTKYVNMNLHVLFLVSANDVKISFPFCLNVHYDPCEECGLPLQLPVFILWAVTAQSQVNQEVGWSLTEGMQCLICTIVPLI